MRTTTYRAPDKRRGYTAGELAGLLAQHPLGARVKIRPGWSGQVQVVIVEEDETGDYPGPADRCETPPPPGTRYDGPTGLGPNLQRRIEGLPEATAVDAALQGSLDATADEEWLREQLRQRGIDVDLVELVARTVQHPVNRDETRNMLAEAGVDLRVIDEVGAQYRERLQLREIARREDAQ